MNGQGSDAPRSSWFQWFSELVTNPMARQQLNADTGLDIDNLGRQRSKQQLIEKHERARKDIKQALSRGMTHITNTHSSYAKPCASRVDASVMHRYTPVHIKDLHVGTTHKGRVLRGTTIVEPMVMNAVSTVLEDENGDAVYVYLYNLLPGGLSSMAKTLAAAEEQLPKGTHLAIVEPFYKMTADGGYGVRVDDPQDVVFLESLAPSSAAGWQAQGNTHYAAKQYSEAASCYSQALLALPGEASSALQDVLLNLSATHLKLGAPGPALQCAAAVLALGSSTASAASASTASNNPTSSSGSSKLLSDASYHAALALDQLGLHHAARYHMTLAADYAEEGGRVGSRVSRQQWMAQLQQPTGRVDKVQARQELARALAGLEGLAGAGAAAQQAGAAAAGGSQKASGGKADAALMKAAVAQCMSAKQHGDECFEAAECSAALQRYTDALQALLAAKQLPVLALLNNRAICQLQLGGTDRLQAALQDAVAALALDVTSEKAHYRRASAALQLGWLQEAAAACRQGLAMVPGSEALQQLKLRLETAAPEAVAAEAADKAGCQPAVGAAGTSGAASTKSSARTSAASTSSASGTGSSSGTTTGSKPKAKGGKKSRRKAQQDSGSRTSAAEPQQMTERDLRNMMHEGGVGADELSRTNDMFAAMLRLQPEMRARAEAVGVGVPIDERIARFHEEFAKEGRWPEQCDVSACQRYLHSAFEHARAMPGFDNLFGPRFTAEQAVQPKDIFKRAGGPRANQEYIDWLLGSESGAVRFWPRWPYSSNILHSFGNVPRKREVLYPGKTHVEVGFLDLSGLAAACAAWKPPMMSRPDPSKEPDYSRYVIGGLSGAEAHSREPVTWVGYDSSPYAVAKTLVVATMMRRGAETDAILQVWYSAAWTRATLAAFREAVTALLAGQAGSAAAGEALAPAVLQLLRHWQLVDVPLRRARQEWLESMNDCNSCAAGFKLKEDRLALVAYELTGQLLGGEVGSVTMYAIPKDYGHRSLEENFLQTLLFSDVAECRTSRRLSDVVAAGVLLLRERISTLAGLLRAGRVEIQIRLGTVEPSNRALQEEISSLQPWAISWSNVPDYMAPQDFHDMARACSRPGGEDTLHSLQSMNWPYDVVGASHIDLLMRKTGDMRGLVKDARWVLQDSFQQLGWQRLLLSPPADIARNIVDYSLYVHHYKRWVAAFLRAGGLPPSQVGHVEMPVYSPTSRANTTLGITFTYDPQISFNALLSD